MPSIYKHRLSHNRAHKSASFRLLVSASTSIVGFPDLFPPFPCVPFWQNMSQCQNMNIRDGTGTMLRNRLNRYGLECSTDTYTHTCTTSTILLNVYSHDIASHRMQWHFSDSINVNAMTAGCFQYHLCKHSDSHFNTASFFHFTIKLTPSPHSHSLNRRSIFTAPTLTVPVYVFCQRYAPRTFSKDSFWMVGCVNFISTIVIAKITLVSHVM